MSIIKRPKYLNWLIETKDSDFVKVLVGVRRSGKTTLLNMMAQHLLENGVEPNQIIQINFEDLSYVKYTNSNELIKYIKNKVIPGKRMYLFIDEVQEVKEWARTINSIRVSLNIDIYITGSNSKVFIGEHLTYMAGRYIQMEVFPLSFKEFIEGKNIQNVSTYINAYKEFILGAFPYIALSDNSVIKKSGMKNLFETVFDRDAILRSSVKNVELFHKVSKFIFDTIGSPISANKIYNTLKSEKYECSQHTIENYFEILKNSYLIYHCPMYDSVGKKLLKTNGKFYSVDNGLIDKSLSGRNIGGGRHLENFIYMELKKYEWNVTCLRLKNDHEIDFVARKDNKQIFIQVTETLALSDVVEREIRPFKQLNLNGERLILSFDVLEEKFENCTHMNVFDFVLNYLPTI